MHLTHVNCSKSPSAPPADLNDCPFDDAAPCLIEPVAIVLHERGTKRCEPLACRRKRCAVPILRSTHPLRFITRQTRTIACKRDQVSFRRIQAQASVCAHTPYNVRVGKSTKVFVADFGGIRRQRPGRSAAKRCAHGSDSLRNLREARTGLEESDFGGIRRQAGSPLQNAALTALIH